MPQRRVPSPSSLRRKLKGLTLATKGRAPFWFGALDHPGGAGDRVVLDHDVGRPCRREG